MNLGVALKLTHLPAIAVNDAYVLAPDADMLYAADADWWQANPQARQFRGLMVTVGESRYPEVLCLKASGAEGFDPDPACIRLGGNSGYQALHIGLHGKASRILLFGYDMHADTDHHWFGRHRGGLRNTHQDDFPRWAARMTQLADAAKDRGVEIINCSMGSKITAFPIRPLEDVL